MLKTTSQQRKWIALAAVLWIVLLIGIIFIPQTRPAAQAAAPTNSLTRALENVRPSGDPAVGEVVDMTRVYDPEVYAGFITLCPGEPEELVDVKLESLGLKDAELDLGGDFGYMLLLPVAQDQEVGVDRIPMSQVDVCTQPMTQPNPLQTAIAFSKRGGTWSLGI